jgi:hypothetical protein
MRTVLSGRLAAGQRWRRRHLAAMCGVWIRAAKPCAACASTTPSRRSIGAFDGIATTSGNSVLVLDLVGNPPPSDSQHRLRGHRLALRRARRLHCTRCRPTSTCACGGPRRGPARPRPRPRQHLEGGHPPGRWPPTASPKTTRRPRRCCGCAPSSAPSPSRRPVHRPPGLLSPPRYLARRSSNQERASRFRLPVPAALARPAARAAQSGQRSVAPQTPHQRQDLRYVTNPATNPTNKAGITPIRRRLTRGPSMAQLDGRLVSSGARDLSAPRHRKQRARSSMNGQRNPGADRQEPGHHLVLRQRITD